MGTEHPHKLETRKPVVKPSDFLYIRKSGHGVFSISIAPDRLQEFSEALYVLFTLYPRKSKSQTLVDIIAHEALLEIRSRPGLLDLLQKDITTLLMVEGDTPPRGLPTIGPNNKSHESDS